MCALADSEIIEDLNQHSFPLNGGPFTLCGVRNRLDLFLVSEEWENHFGGLL